MAIRFARVAVRSVPLITCAYLLWSPGLAAQRGGAQWEGVPPVQVADVTFLHTANEPNILVRVVTRGLTDASSFAFLPDGSILVTEKEGRLRIIRNGVLDPAPVLEIPVNHGSFSGLTDVALHPDFVRNQLVYLTYARSDGGRGIVLAHGRFDGRRLSGLETVFETTGGPIGASASRILFAEDGTLYMSVAGAFNLASTAARAQDPHDHAGKILRLTDDGKPAPGNPFVGDDRYLPEIYTLGHRNPMGLAFHPVTGELWADEHGPQGGDEVNIILAGHNYGWPTISYGRDYPGPRVSERWYQEGVDIPTIVFLPSIATSGMTFYTGDRFPGWKGNLFVGSLMEGRIRRTGHIERVILNEDAEEVGREPILTELRQRIRDVHQGPDGLIYALTDEDEGTGMLLRIEPVD